MQVLAEIAPGTEKYSIDECFLDLTGMPEDLTAFCRRVRTTVRQCTGLPVGIAETRTLARTANRIAKTSNRTEKVLDLADSLWSDRALELTEVGEVWRIGRQYTYKLNGNGVLTVPDLAHQPYGWVRKEMGVCGLRTVRELRSEDCFEDVPQPKQTTMVSRSFDAEVRDREELANAIRAFAAAAAHSIRKADLVSSSVDVLIETNRFSTARAMYPRNPSRCRPRPTTPNLSCRPR